MPETGCKSGKALDCSDGINCTIDSCTKGKGCEAVPDQGACDDGTFCNGEEICDPEIGCVKGKPLVKDDGIACTKDACNEIVNEVLNIADDKLCNDNNPCTVDSCDLKKGCINTPLDGVACNDNNGCTVGETCVAGQCSPKETCADKGLICSDDKCVGLGTATVTFVSGAGRVKSEAGELHLLVTPVTAGSAKTDSFEAIWSALLRKLTEIK